MPEEGHARRQTHTDTLTQSWPRAMNPPDRPLHSIANRCIAVTSGACFSICTVVRAGDQAPTVPPKARGEGKIIDRAPGTGLPKVRSLTLDPLGL